MINVKMKSENGFFETLRLVDGRLIDFFFNL